MTPALPAGLALDTANGRLSGTPQAAGSSTHTITVRDTTGSTDTTTITITIVTVPTAPTITDVAKPNTVNGGLDVSWTAPTSNGGAPIDGYEIQYRTQAQGQTPAGSWAPFNGAVSGSPTRVTGLVKSTKYDFRMRAQNSAGWGPYSTAFGNSAQPG